MIDSAKSFFFEQTLPELSSIVTCLLPTLTLTSCGVILHEPSFIFIAVQLLPIELLSEFYFVL